jgi:hypothetical protein
MKMTPDWMKATTEHLAEWGFTVASSVEDETVDEQLVLTRTRYELARHAHERLAMEALVYADGATTYWLEILRWHGMSSFPYRLDSWRHRPGQVEFKYAIDPDTGMGLSFFVKEEELSSLSPS